MGLGFKLSEPNISSLLSGEIIKVSTSQVSRWENMKEKHSSMTNQSLKNKVIGDFSGFQEKKRYFCT